MFLKQKTINKVMSVKKPCILEYVKRETKVNLQIFFIWHRQREQFLDY